MPHINDAKYSKLGGSGSIDDREDAFTGGPHTNDGWYSTYGGTADINDDAMTWLGSAPQNATGGHINDRFFNYWTS